MSDADPEVPDADAQEQRQTTAVDPEHDPAPGPTDDVEAPEADALEQAQEVGDDDEVDDRR